MKSAAEYTSGSAVNSESTPAAESTTQTTDTSAVSSESQSSAVESGAEVEANEEETTSQEGTEEAGTEGKKSHQKTLEERAEEIADRKIQQRLAEQEAKRKAEITDRPDFIEINTTAYDTHIARLIAAERGLQDELALDPDNPVELVRKIRAIQYERQSLETEFQENEKKREAWEARNQQTQKERESQQLIQQDIQKAVVDIPKARGIAPEVVEAGMKFVFESFQKDPLLEKRFDDIVMHKAMYQGFSGPTAAVDWIVTYAQENMGKATQAERYKRENGKLLNPGGAGNSGGSFDGVNSFDDLLKLPSSQVNQFAKEHPQKFQNLKDKHFK